MNKCDTCWYITVPFSFSASTHRKNNVPEGDNPFGYVVEPSRNWFHYLQSRYYDPAVRRFINADGELSGVGSVSGYNLYVYCFNNPVNLIDPLGNWPDWGKLVTGALLGVAATLTVAAVLTNPIACLPLAMQGAQILLGTAGFVGMMIASNEISESFTGENPMKESLGEENYDMLTGAAVMVMSFGATFFEFAGNFNVCFVAGTPVETENGRVSIENITVGTEVYAYNIEQDKNELKRVVRVFENKTTELVHVFINGNETVCTSKHPFYSPVKGWISACKLRAGDILLTLNGEYVVVEKIQHELLESPIRVYNLEVEDLHNYYVVSGDVAVLVHNECSDSGFSPEQKYIIQMGKEYEKTGINRQEAHISVDFAKQYGINSHYPKKHPERSGYWSIHEHIKIFKYHIEIKDD